MSAASPFSLDALAVWVRAADEHAPARLPLLERAERILAGEEEATEPERGELAERLERWRYQHLLAACGFAMAAKPQAAALNDGAGTFAPEDRRLADTLDLTANALAGRPARLPRWPRGAVLGHECGDAEVAQVNRCLDENFPLEHLAEQAAAITANHFHSRGPSPTDNGPWSTGGRFAAGCRRILLYAPLYLSSHCINHCLYCGFRYPHQIERRHLDFDAAMRQADILQERGFHNILLVAGDFPSLTTTKYFVPILRALAERGMSPAVEIAPQTPAGYAELTAAGACGVTLYQETYDEALYAAYHPRGSKVSYDWRLEALERAAEAGIRRLGLGFLVGLADPHKDLAALVRHGVYLRDRFPDCTLAFSLPRIREAPPGFAVPCPVDDETFVRMYCGLRLAFPRAGLVLSTREPPELRNRLARVCITQMSAGSSTAPGGYGNGQSPPAGGQFPVCDHRSPAEVAAWLAGEGIEVAWK